MKEKASACSVRNDGLAGRKKRHDESCPYKRGFLITLGMTMRCVRGGWLDGLFQLVIALCCGARKDEERFLSSQADTFAGANVKEEASACSVRNDGRAGGGGKESRGRCFGRENRRSLDDP